MIKVLEKEDVLIFYKKEVVMRIIALFIIASLFFGGNEEVFAQDTSGESEVQEVRLMRQKGRSIAQEEYYIKLLELSLEKTKDTHGPYEMVLTDTAYFQREGLVNMRRGEDIDVIYTMTSNAREMVFRPVRIPILKGLAGHRISFVKEGDEDIMVNVTLKADLANFAFTQGSDWPDTEILEKNGLEVIKNQNYNELFNILLNGRADAFPRAATEITGEIEAHKDKKIALEQNVVIQYPTAFYYFVKKSNTSLAERIEAGLKKAIEDGSFQTMFDIYNGQYIKKLNLDQRQYINLDNPLLPEKTPVNESHYWLDVGSADL